MAVLLVALGTVACTGRTTRSAEAFCGEIDEAEQRMREVAARADAAPDPFTGLMTAMGGVGEIERVLKELAKVAPSEIQSDTEAVRDAWARQTDLVGDAATNPIGAFATSFYFMVTVEPSMQAMDEFAVEHCDTTLFGSVAVSEKD